MQKHFCGDQLKSVSINEEPKPCCPHDAVTPLTHNSNESNDCCNDSSESLDWWEVPSSTKAPQLFIAQVPPIDLSTLFLSKKRTKLLIYSPNPPPPLPGNKILIEIQKFTC